MFSQLVCSVAKLYFSSEHHLLLGTVRGISFEALNRRVPGSCLLCLVQFWLSEMCRDIKERVCPFSICSWRSLEVCDVSCVDLEETVNFWFPSICFLWKLATKLFYFNCSDFLRGLFKGLSSVHVDQYVLWLFSNIYFFFFYVLSLSIALWRWQLFHLLCIWKLHSFVCKVPGTCTFMSHSVVIILLLYVLITFFPNVKPNFTFQ